MIAESSPGASLAELLAEPLEATRARERHALDALLEACGGSVVLFGVGSTGTRALACLRSIGLEPLAFADNNPATWGRSIDGTVVMSPEAAARTYGSNAAFIVTIWNPAHRYAETKVLLEALGVATIAPVSTLHWRFPEAYLPFFSFDLPHRLHGERHAMQRAANIWADETSRAEYAGHLHARLSGNFMYPAPVAGKQYFPHFIDLLPNESFVDCGAYDGDTIREFIAESGGRFEHILALEPSPATFAELDRLLEGLERGIRARIRTERYAVGDRAGYVRFAAAGGTGDRIASNGTLEVESRTLDRICTGMRTSFVKMDIEGAEAAALAGARATILRDRPVIAVCVYHRPSDLWRLPLWIADLVPDYRFYLRSHGNDAWETVAYAVPPERARQ